MDDARCDVAYERASAIEGQPIKGQALVLLPHHGELEITSADPPEKDLQSVLNATYREQGGDGLPAGTDLRLTIAKGVVEAIGGNRVAENPIAHQCGARIALRFPVGEQPVEIAASD